MIHKAVILTVWGKRESSREGWVKHRMDVLLPFKLASTLKITK